MTIQFSRQKTGVKSMTRFPPSNLPVAAGEACVR
ncbi:hypothetical protein PMI22_05474, partial [Pseudomonas sp. GM21]